MQKRVQLAPLQHPPAAPEIPAPDQAQSSAADTSATTAQRAPRPRPSGAPSPLTSSEPSNETLPRPGPSVPLPHQVEPSAVSGSAGVPECKGEPGTTSDEALEPRETPDPKPKTSGVDLTPGAKRPPLNPSIGRSAAAQSAPSSPVATAANKPRGGVLVAQPSRTTEDPFISSDDENDSDRMHQRAVAVGFGNQLSALLENGVRCGMIDENNMRSLLALSGHGEQGETSNPTITSNPTMTAVGGGGGSGSLQAWLVARGVDLSTFGHGDARTVNALQTELENGECALAGRATPNGLCVVREVTSCVVQLQYKGMMLLERRTDGDSLLAEKVLASEQWHDAAMRACAELGIRSEHIKLSETVKREEKTAPSRSYPAIATEYTLIHCEAELLAERLSFANRSKIGIIGSDGVESFSPFTTPNHEWAWGNAEKWALKNEAHDGNGGHIVPHRLDASILEQLGGETLDLSTTSLCNADIISLAGELRENTTTLRVDLSAMSVENSTLSTAAAEALAELVKRNKTMTSLALRYDYGSYVDESS